VAHLHWILESQAGVLGQLEGQQVALHLLAVVGLAVVGGRQGIGPSSAMANRSSASGTEASGIEASGESRRDSWGRLDLAAGDQQAPG
jgi:hypothetical protein